MPSNVRTTPILPTQVLLHATSYTESIDIHYTATTFDFRDPMQLVLFRESPNFHCFQPIRSLQLEYTLYSGYDWSAERGGPVIFLPFVIKSLPRLQYLRMTVLVCGAPSPY